MLFARGGFRHSRSALDCTYGGRSWNSVLFNFPPSRRLPMACHLPDGREHGPQRDTICAVSRASLTVGIRLGRARCACRAPAGTVQEMGPCASRSNPRANSRRTLWEQRAALKKTLHPRTAMTYTAEESIRPPLNLAQEPPGPGAPLDTAHRGDIRGALGSGPASRLMGHQ